MYKVVFDSNGEMITFSLEQHASIDGFVYYEAPEEFDPKKHVCYLQNNTVQIRPIGTEVEELDDLFELQKQIGSHTVNGKILVENTQGVFLKRLLDAEISEGNYLILQEAFYKTFLNLQLGDWLSAKFNVYRITVTAVVKQDIINDVGSKIDLYISKRYPIINR